MKAIGLTLTIVSVLALVFWGMTCSPVQASPANQAAQSSDPHASGRPGVFRFHPYKEMQQDRVELAELRVGIERLQHLLPDVQDATAQQELKTQLAHWQSRILREEQRLDTSASPMAAEVEMRLNAMKGSSTCGVCHGTENIGIGGVPGPDLHGGL